MKNYTLLLLCLILSIKALSAQTGVFRATVSKNPVGVNETFQLTFSLENLEGGNFTPPNLDDFYLRSGPNQSSSISNVNGQISRTLSISYFLQPKSEGTFNIGAAKLEHQGKVYQSNAIKLTVNTSGTGSPPSGGNRTNPQNPQGQAPSITQQISDNLYLRVFTDKDECFVGEQLTVTFKLYTNLQIGNTSIKKMPSFNGFLSQEINLDQVEFKPEVVNGVQFQSAIVKRFALFPQRSGKLSIEPMEMESYVRIQGPRRGFFDDFFGNYQTVAHLFSSNTREVTVNLYQNLKSRHSSMVWWVNFNWNQTPIKT